MKRTQALPAISLSARKPLPASDLWHLLALHGKAYLGLTKPTLQLLVVLTGAAALIAEGSLLLAPLKFALALLFLALSAGSAKALNQYLERQVDQVMSRTRFRRPLPLGLISPREALIFALVLGLAAVFGFAYYFNLLAALLCVLTILFYTLFYTLYLKPRTPYSIVIGGIAGGMGPLISWAATGGAYHPLPLLMLVIIFVWTPGHFWALALKYQDDFRRVGYPMLPVVSGEAQTWKAIHGSMILTVILSFSLLGVGSGWVFAVAAALLGGYRIIRLQRARSIATAAAAGRVFLDSIVYLLGLFAFFILDRLLM